ncbi:MAG: DUF695 domain-containing protein [Pseudomonadota bacterium]|nr:DUF695 domain-containing protein [Pseudomonadota bacterium]
MADGTWDFYFTHDGEVPLVIALDLAMGPHAPRADLPERLILSVRMKAPMANGLRASVEASALFDLEERLSDTLEAAGWAPVGRVVTRGRSDFIYYGPVGDLPELPLGEYAATHLVHTDASWDLYRNFLWPGSREWQQMQNRRVVIQLRSHGDKLDVPRPIDHLARAQDEDAAQAAAANLTAAGFKVRSLDSNDDGTWRVAFEKEDAPAQMDGVTAAVLDAIEGMDDVDYDGWGCAVIAEEAAP